MSVPQDETTKPSALPVTSPIDLTTNGPARSSNLPVTSWREPGSQPVERSGFGWKIATALLALSTVGAIAWGVTTTNTLQNDVSSLNTKVTAQAVTIERQQAATEATGILARLQIDSLDEQVSELATALGVLEEQAGYTFDYAQEEYEQVSSKLKKAKKSTATLEKELSASRADTGKIAAAHATAQAELAKTQEALITLQTKILEEVQGPTDF